MAAISTQHGIVMHELSKRKNWAQKEAGVVVVFCIVFLGASPSYTILVYISCVICEFLLTFNVVAVGVIGIYVNKCLQRRKERKAVVA